MEFDALWRRISKHCILLSSIVLLPVAASFIYIFIGPKQFAAVSTLEARPVTPQPNDDDVFGKVLSDGPVGGLSEVDIATTQVKLLHYDFLARVASDAILQEALGPSFPEAAGGGVPLDARIVRYLGKHVQISRVRGTRLMDIACTHSDAKIAALIVNRFVTVLITDGVSSREAFTSNKIDGLDEDFRKVEARLDEAQRRVALYLLSVDVREALKDARNEVKTLSGRYGERHPNMKAAVSVVEAHEEELLAELERLKTHPMEAAYWATALESQSEEAQVDALQVETLLTGRYEALTSEVAALRSLSESLNVRLNEVRIANSRPDLDLRVAQTAVAEAARQVAPNRKLSVAAGLLLGLFLGFAKLVTLGSPPSRISSSEDWFSATSLPLLGQIDKLPHNAAQAEVVDAVEGNHALAEQIRNLRSRLISPALNQPSVMMVTSALPEEGKSALAAALALSLSRMEPAGVVLVDIDLYQASVHRTLELPNFLGVSDVLTGKCTLDEGLTVIGDLMVLTGGSSESVARHHLGGLVMSKLVDKLKRRFRYVIFDSPPVIPSADTRLIAPLCDEVLLVVTARTTPVSAVQAAEFEIASVNGAIRGGILNQTPPASYRSVFSCRSVMNGMVDSVGGWRRNYPVET